MRFFSKILLSFLLLSFSIGHCQQKTRLSVKVDSINPILKVNQIILFTNSSQKPLSQIVLNDWNESYSNRKTNLGKRLSDEYVRSFHLSREKERGKTTINSVSINETTSVWERKKEQIDLITIKLEKRLLPGESINIELEYNLKIPEDKFTRYGYNKGNFYLKDSFLNIARLDEKGNFVEYSNENIDDATNEIIEFIAAEFILPKSYSITTNLNQKSEEITTQKTITFEGSNLTDYTFAIEKRNTFESFTNETMLIETNLKVNKVTEVQKAIVIDKVVKFIEVYLGSSQNKKIMVSQIDYDRNPLYGLNQLPSFLSPFPNSFLYELEFLKAYSNNYLKQNLKIDYRKDHYIIDAIQTYILIEYINEFYPDLDLIGNIGKIKLLKGFQLSKAKFNKQYEIVYLLTARRNLDQSLDESKENLIKFNERISGKYKAGLSFQYLNKYLGENIVPNSFKEFTQLNGNSKTTLSQFEGILQKNSKRNINWFFENIVRSKTSVDYGFGELEKLNDSIKISIINKGNRDVPITLSGFKKRKLVFEKWLPNIKHDSVLVFPKNELDKLIINNSNDLPEINNRNNLKSLKGIFSLNRPLKFTLLKDIENRNYSQIFYYPEIGYNVYDGAILSFKFNNRSLIEKPFSIDLGPSFSTRTSSLTGDGSVSYTQQRPNSKLYQIRYSLGGAYFHYVQNAAYLRFTPLISFRFRDLDLRKNFRQTLTFRQVVVNKEPNPLKKIETTPLNYSVFDTRYGIGDNETARSYGLSTNVQLSSKFGKFIIEGGYSKLFESNYQIGVRVYAGTFLYKKTDTEYFNFGLDRPKDYLFDYNFYGRSETSGLFSQQIIIAEGGFKSKFVNPYANEWLTSINVTSSVWKSIQLYGDAGLYKNKGFDPKFVYDSGVQLNLVPGYFELFFPVYSSNGFELGERNYQEKIRFVVTLSPRTLISLFTRKWF
ncbi:gluzincin family metallopeptidase [Flavobacterium terrae]|uniref:Peptidase M1 membrane alanine aminopeptidase domain-containing protein n=1 Tax=Flavobacterium terrae TaxID=415425 RepID=A0A1M6GWC8_9FLAO|nr:aminopeptidase [Flavobacterium terrae]SHJ14220.1 hypothetical protein SAMN05444363_2765 [Flavobacterium terrae]